MSDILLEDNTDKFVDVMVRLCNGEEVPMTEITDAVYWKNFAMVKNGFKHIPSGDIIPFNTDSCLSKVGQHMFNDNEKITHV